MRSFGTAACLLVLAIPALQAQDSSSAKQESASAKSAVLQWAPAPAVFPKGAMMAVVDGDPSQAGPFEVQLSFPNGYKIPPHFHPTEETMEVKQGTFLVGMGDRLDVKKTAAMKKGDHGTIPADHHHYGVAKGKTVVDVKSTGPFAMTYVDPADDPQGEQKTP
jgi:quercetin dioxygenase-like cupin family protein